MHVLYRVIEWKYFTRNGPQSRVLGHCLAEGLVSGWQLDNEQVTAPGAPDWPSPNPHFVEHPRGSSCTQLPGGHAKWVCICSWRIQSVDQACSVAPTCDFQFSWRKKSEVNSKGHIPHLKRKPNRSGTISFGVGIYFKKFCHSGHADVPFTLGKTLKRRL